MMTQAKLLKNIATTFSHQGHKLVARQATVFLDEKHMIIFWVTVCTTCGKVITTELKRSSKKGLVAF